MEKSFESGDEVCLIGFPEIRLVVITNDTNGLGCRYWCNSGFAEIRLPADQFEFYKVKKKKAR